MWWFKRKKQRDTHEDRPGAREAEPPDSPTNLQDRIIRLAKSGMLRTALDEVLRGLRQDPDDFFLLHLGAAIAGTGRTANQRATEPTTSAQRRSALLASVATECSSCRRTWYSGHRLLSSPADFHLNPAGLQCQKCRYTLCRDCLDNLKLVQGDPVDKPIAVIGACPELGHGVLGTPVLATGRSDVTSIRPDRIEAVIVTRDGPIPPTLDEALEVVPRFIPLIAGDTSLIRIYPSRPGVMAGESSRAELALARINDLEREGVIAHGAQKCSDIIFAKIHDMSSASYLLIVVGKPGTLREVPSSFAG